MIKSPQKRLKNSIKAEDENLGLIGKCMVCSKKYGSARLNIIEKNDSEKLLHITCPNCQHATIIRIGCAGAGIMALGSVTDLSLNDVRFMRLNNKITEDEFLENVNVLKIKSKELINFLTAFSGFSRDTADKH